MAGPIDIDVWTWSLEPAPDVLARLSSHLSDAERQRAARFLNPAHGAHYAAGRGTLREVLATCTGRAPHALQFDAGPSGKPMLPGGIGNPHFNLSHTGAFAALAVTTVAEIGIDIERIRSIEMDVARRFFAPAEVAAILVLPASEHMAAFYRCWTRKEAFVKALGDGLHFPLDAFEVSLDVDRPPVLRALAGTDAANLHHWRFAHLRADDLAPGLVGAIALKTAGDDRPLRLNFRQP